MSAEVGFAPRNVVIHLEAGHRRSVRVTFSKMSIYARSGRLGLERVLLPRSLPWRRRDAPDLVEAATDPRACHGCGCTGRRGVD